MSGYLACMYISILCVQCFQRQEERVRSPENGGTSGYELPCLCWELKLALLKTHQVLITTKPSPQPPTLDILTIEMKKHDLYVYTSNSVMGSENSHTTSIYKWRLVEALWWADSSLNCLMCGALTFIEILYNWHVNYVMCMLGVVLYVL